MSRRVYFVRNSAGFRELLNSPEVTEIVTQCVSAIAEQCGDGYEGDVRNGNRAVGKVSAETIRAKRSNAKHNTLLKALGSIKI